MSLVNVRPSLAAHDMTNHPPTHAKSLAQRLLSYAAGGVERTNKVNVVAGQDRPLLAVLATVARWTQRLQIGGVAVVAVAVSVVNQEFMRGPTTLAGTLQELPIVARRHSTVPCGMSVMELDAFGPTRADCSRALAATSDTPGGTRRLYKKALRAVRANALYPDRLLKRHAGLLSRLACLGCRTTNPTPPIIPCGGRI